jgi:exodeoxyribonuclease-3
MKIATWNVNSVRARLDHITEWIEENQPDLLCLQEIKVQDSEFPIEAFTDLNQQVYTYGQKAYNGVAFITPHTLTDVKCGMEENEFEGQKRLIMAKLKDITVINIYAPNGQDPESDKFVYKERWYKALKKLFANNFTQQDKVLICGDFNIAPEDRDVHSPDKMLGRCGFHPLEHKWLADFVSWGLTDTFRMHCDEDKIFSWWDYRHGSFAKNRGMRIDHIFVSNSLVELCKNTYIDVTPRKLERPSDHAPVVIELNI